MAALTHLGVGLMAKPAAPKIPLAILIVSAYTIDLLWGLFFVMGVEGLPEPGVKATNAWSHSLFMALAWSILAAVIAWRVGLARQVNSSARIGLIIGLLVFSHWLVDFISHPMTAVYPDDTGLPLFVDGSPLVGLGFWTSQLGVIIGELGVLILGLAVYIYTRPRWRRDKPETLIRA